MAAKKTLLCWLGSDDDLSEIEGPARALSQVGLDLEVARWTDDLPNMAWLGLVGPLVDAPCPDVVVFAGSQAELTNPSIRYGLSMATATVDASRESGLVKVVAGLDFEPAPGALPTLLGNFVTVAATTPAWAAGVVAAAHGGRPTAPAEDFRLNVIGIPGLGQWFEVGPREDAWAGALFGVSAEGEITHCGVGKAGEIPSTSTLEYPARGIELEVGGTACKAWSVQNRIGAEESFYVRVDGHPHRILFGGHPGTDQAEVTVIDLA